MTFLKRLAPVASSSGGMKQGKMKAELGALTDNYAPRAKVRRKPVTYEQLIASCQAFDAMIKAGVIENLAIRSLTMVIGVYADEVHGGKILLVSRAARLAPHAERRREHGAPRVPFTRLIMKTYRENKLSKAHALALIEKHWQIAIITKEEDQRLTDLGLRSKLMESARARWAVASIVFE
jgi:hypothetical protein